MSNFRTVFGKAIEQHGHGPHAKVYIETMDEVKLTAFRGNITDEQYELAANENLIQLYKEGEHYTITNVVKIALDQRVILQAKFNRVRAQRNSK